MKVIAGTLPEPKHQSIKKRTVAPVATMPTPHERETKAKVEKSKAGKKKPGAWIASWWPVGVAVFLSGFAPEWYTMASQSGIWGLRLAFPLVQVAIHGNIGLSEQMALYLQLPIEGLITKFSLDHGMSLKSAAAQLIAIHLISAFVLWLITFAAH